MRKTIGFTAGFIAGATVVAFAASLYFQNIPQNVATWALWFCLDVLVFASSVKAGNKEAYLVGCYMVGAGLVTLMVLTNGTWQWSVVETAASVGAGLAIIAWWRAGPKWAVVMGNAAMSIAAIPTVVDAWVSPTPASGWMWTTTAVCSLVAIAAARKWTIEDRLFPVVGFCIDGIVAVLVLRG